MSCIYNLRDSVWLCCSSSLCEEQITTSLPEAGRGDAVQCASACEEHGKGMAERNS